MFLIYIYDLSEGLSANAKLFSDNTSLFSVVHDKRTSANDLSKDLKMIHNWAFQWKMNFDLDPTKQAKEVIFSRKKKTTPFSLTQLVFTCSKLTIEILEQGVKYVQS